MLKNYQFTKNKNQIVYNTFTATLTKISFIYENY